jgi:hypothetical protein
VIHTTECPREHFKTKTTNQYLSITMPGQSTQIDELLIPNTKYIFKKYTTITTSLDIPLIYQMQDTHTGK